MSNKLRNHKDNVFCLLYREKKNLLSLYNAINGTDYREEEELEVVTLDGAICMQMKNDAAFVIDSRLNLYEQQASVNPNMPLRDLYYVTEELKKIAPTTSLYSTRKVKIPVPGFIVFFNGVAEQPKRQVYRLSDLFSKEEADPDLELKVTVLNINPGCNDELLQKCESLRGYMAFVQKVRTGREKRMALEKAVPWAVDACIAEGILADFFRKNRKEIIDMGIWEFDQELYEKALREDGRADGWEKGREEGIEQGIEQGIKGTVAILKELNIPTEEVLIKIEKQYHLNPEDSKKYV